MREDNKNLLLAIALSVAVLLGWQYFFAVPQVERPRQATPPTQQVAPGQAVNPNAPNPPTSPSQAGGPANPVPGTAPAPSTQTVEPREQTLQRAPRVRIDTPAISGSINLRGARIDDV